MYGLIMNSIKNQIIDDYGEATWLAVKRAANYDDEGFISMNTYDDALAYTMVEAICGITGKNADEALERIGEYWIQHTGKNGYGPLLDAAGLSFAEYIANLNNMHDTVSIAMPQMIIPYFSVHDVTDNSLKLQYISNRKGLEPMVIGLVKALGKKFGHNCIVQREADDTAAAGEPKKGVFFTVKW